MGSANQKEAREAAVATGNETALYRVLLDNQINMRVIVVLHGAALSWGMMTSAVGTSCGTCCNSSGQAKGEGCYCAQSSRGRSPSSGCDFPVHVFPIAPKMDDSVPVPLALPFQYQANFIAGFHDAWETSVLVSVFTVVTIEGAEYIDGYVYINHPLPALHNFLVNPALLLDRAAIAEGRERNDKNKHKKSKRDSRDREMARAGDGNVIVTTPTMTMATTTTGASNISAAAANSMLRIQITPSDLARRCKFDQPIAQLPFLAMLTSSPIEPRQVTSGPAEPILPSGAGLGVFRPNLAPSLRLL